MANHPREGDSVHTAEMMRPPANSRGPVTTIPDAVERTAIVVAGMFGRLSIGKAFSISFFAEVMPTMRVGLRSQLAHARAAISSRAS
jgi:hypothetical protein